MEEMAGVPKPGDPEVGAPIDSEVNVNNVNKVKPKKSKKKKNKFGVTAPRQPLTGNVFVQLTN